MIRSRGGLAIVDGVNSGVADPVFREGRDCACQSVGGGLEPCKAVRLVPARFRGRLDGLDARQREAVEALTKGLVNKLLHEPTVRLKEAAGSTRGERLAAALRDLFGL